MSTLKKKNTNCTVLVPSCDAYMDLWKPFFTLFFRYWNDCPYDVYLGSNQMSYDDEQVKMIHSNQGMNWANRVREQVEAMTTEYVILFLEDFFLQAKVDQSQVNECLDFLIESNGDYVRLIPWPGPTKKVKEQKLVGEIEKGQPYRVSTQAAIWKKSSLLKLMQPNESIWQFEIDGSKRSDLLFPNSFYGTWKWVMPYKHHVVERGKWFPWEAKKFAKMNIGCDFTKRELMTKKEAYIWKRYRFITTIYKLIPYKIRKKMGGSIAELPNF